MGDCYLLYKEIASLLKIKLMDGLGIVGSWCKTTELEPKSEHDMLYQNVSM